MRILDLETRQPCNQVLVMLTPAEAKELDGALEGLLDDPEHDGHVHVPDAEYRREITVGIYTPENLDQFSPEVQLLIRRDA